MKPLLERVVDKFTVGDGCWLWTAGTNSAGYGQIKISGTQVLAHRFVYELLVGPIPEGLQLDHLCRIHNCVRPKHLEPVTNAENQRRGAKGQATRCVNGHEYTPENTGRSNGRRACRKCNRARCAAYYRRRKKTEKETTT